VGGVAGVSAALAEGAALSGRPRLERWARLAAAGGAAVGTVALVHDLGTPSRFLNMLRVFKPTSPLSVGSWLLAPFGALSAASAVSAVTGFARPLGRLAGLGSAVLGPPLVTYTAALLCDTAVPAWHEAYREMPFLFAGGGASAAGGLAMMAVPVAEAAPARRLAVLGATADVAATELIERRLGMLGEPYQEGRPGRLMKAARAFTVAGAAGTLVGRRSRAVSVASGAALTVGSLLIRFGVFQAGMASAKDPKYTVAPQRERLDRGETATVPGH
ncbi:MAG TPA: polysulfide reductase, partial [Nocardioidaceae bacterium]|nr:polysulfide reductase [Nocardioidaceae bacterium]